MSNNEFSNDFEIQDAEASSVGMNNFVFHNNQEFINFQRCFVDGHDPDYEPVFQQNTDTELVFHPSNECDHITLTFMYNGGQPYQIINNRAFYLKGFKKIVIQGARSRKSQRCNIPVLEVVNECAEGAPTYLDSNGNACHSYTHDDAIFNIQNPHSNPVDVVVSDIEFRVAFKLQDVESAQMHEHWYDPTICPVLFKVYEASSFKMFNVKMYSQYLNFTHVFIHWCENVDIRNCVFRNYNARKIGGNLWLCQRVKNVTIVNNDFYKYGNDENIAIWGDSIMSRDEIHCYNSKDTLVGLDDEKYANRHLEFEHIHIKNNRFYYEKPAHPFESESEDFPEVVDLGFIHTEQLRVWEENDSEPQWDGVIDIFQTLYVSQHTPFVKIKFNTESTSEEDNDHAIVPYVHFHISDVVVSGNEYYINSPMRTLMGYTFDNFCRTEGIQITNNLIKHGSWAHNQCQLQDFKIVYDKNPDREAGTDLEGTNKMCLDPIRIEGNTIECAAIAYMSYQNIPHEEITEGEVNPVSAISTMGDTLEINDPQEYEDDIYHSEEHFILNIENASVLFNNNVVNNTFLSMCEENDENCDFIANDMRGFILLYSREKGGRISMANNVLRGMRNLGSFRMPNDNVFSRIELKAHDNVFQGTTVFLNEFIKEGVFEFSNNIFFTEHPLLLLQELPKHTIVVLNNNLFKNTVDTGKDNSLYYCDTHDIPVPEKLTIISSGNKFENVKGCLCSQYANSDIQIFSTNEHPLDEYFGDEN